MSLLSDLINLNLTDSTERVIAEYIWIGGSGMDLRSKARTLDGPVSDPKELPKWNYDGSSTGQAPGEDSEVIIYPQAIFKDPFRRGNNILVMCDAYTPQGEPIPTNKRAKAAEIFSNPAVDCEVPWFGIEQEYTLLQKEINWPLGWPKGGFPGPQGPYYCGIGADKAFGRDIVDAHYKACLYAGINISGINGEVMPGQWEFQVGPAVGISAGDELWVARYILERITEIAGVVVSFDPKPIPGDWNGAGAHTNYSTKTMREDGGYDAILKAIEKLGLRHKEHIAAYGEGNERRLTGKHETASINTFLWKFVLKLDLHDGKEKQKALKTVSALPGIDSIAMDMKDKKLTVIGIVDPITTVSKLRKYWPSTVLISVGPAKEPEKPAEKKEGEAAKATEDGKKEEGKKEGGGGEEGKKEERKKEGGGGGEEGKKEGGEEKKKAAPPQVIQLYDPMWEMKARGYNPQMFGYNNTPPMMTYYNPHHQYNPPMTSYYPPPPMNTHYAQTMEENPNALQDKEVLTKERKDPRFILFLLPEDYEIEKDTLIQLWMATECIKDEPMELHGDDCFRIVLDEEYLLHCGTNFMTGKDRYRINANKINELLNTVKDDACYYLQWKKEFQNNPMAVESIQHVSLGCTTEIDAATFETLEKFKELRTLLFLGNHCHNRVIQMPRHLYSSFSKLEALDLSRTHMKELPSTIGDMSQLRYLDLSWTLIEWLPEILCSLTELQTLKLRECSNLTVLPEQLKELTKLRHLDVDVLGQLEVMPKGIGELVHLRTLPGFLVGTEDGCEIKELGKLNSLSGQLCIANLENVADKYEAKGAALRRKQHLEKLELRWTASEICGTHHNSEAILEELEPSKELGELEISCYEGESIPGWIEDTDYYKLVSIVLYRCENLSEFPVVDHLPNLKHLELVRTNSVRKIGGNRQDDDDYDVAFPKLEKLEINEMQSLEKWDWKKRNEDDFRSLTHLIIENCPELQEFDVLPHLSSIRYLEIRECRKLQSLSDRKLPDSLQELIVDNCPPIQKKCIRDKGEDWCKIKHVPNISIEEVNEDE